jgi:hypothetical protein
MFSPFGRADFDEQDPRLEGLLSVLARAGYAWLDRQSIRLQGGLQGAIVCVNETSPARPTCGAGQMLRRHPGATWRTSWRKPTAIR